MIKEMVETMTPSKQLHQTIKDLGIDFVVSVPCKLLGDLMEHVAGDDSITYTPVTREEEGVGILAGAYFSGKKPAILMQNSGLGNSINAIMSLLHYYKVPVMFFMSHRGSEGEPVEAQTMMGNAVHGLLEASSIPFVQVASPADLEQVKETAQKGYAEEQSAAFLFPFSYWEGK
ncbi:sulfopyruvate decarboxylase subunit alpha [Magnetovibrio sp. PR-2]|uniref:sulfopyruvate decarboxylase subunit alpha n=1 Tax=Magnetovibrio sp. PR-2 TaxID=3120356 RepID=UPI002FCE08B5